MEAVSGLNKVRLTGGPQDGTVIGDGTPPGLIIVMPRIPEDGPMVNDCYRLTSAALNGTTRVAVFAGTEAIPEPPELPKDDDQVPPLDPELAEYLDWPLYFPDDSVHCNKFPDCKNRFCTDPLSGQVYIASARRLTIREFLADIKAHAEDTSGTT